jgi:hypothetical protein
MAGTLTPLPTPEQTLARREVLRQYRARLAAELRELDATLASLDAEAEGAKRTPGSRP